jgi:hypothetical protein
VPDPKRETIARYLAAGVPQREIARLTGVSTGAISRQKKQLDAARSSVSAAPFDGTPQTAPYHPPVSYASDQPRPPPTEIDFRADYHGHTFRAISPSQAFDGWSVERIRSAIAMHDQGLFYESAILAVTISRFAPVFAALKQVIAPILSLPRHVQGGQRGLARILRDEVEARLAPSTGLRSSPYFPETLYGSTAIDVTQMGFYGLQHAYGDPDPATGVRPVYTRRWPAWAMRRCPYRNTFIAITTEGEDDMITGEGKWTVGGDTDEPHLNGAIRAAGLEVLDGTLIKQARASYIDKYGNPKIAAVMPEKQGTGSVEGDKLLAALNTMLAPDGIGVFAHGTDFKSMALTSSQSTVFKDALDNIWMCIAAIFLGSDGTLSSGTGGVYTPPMYQGIARTVADRTLKTIVRGINTGEVYPWLQINYATTIAETRGWVDPVLSIPLPDPEADARKKAEAEAIDRRSDIIIKMRTAKLEVTQEEVDRISEAQGIPTVPLASVSSVTQSIALAPTDIAKVVRVDEARASQGLGPIGDERGVLTIGELDALAKVPPAPAEPTPTPDQPTDADAAESTP